MCNNLKCKQLSMDDLESEKANETTTNGVDLSVEKEVALEVVLSDFTCNHDHHHSRQL